MLIFFEAHRLHFVRTYACELIIFTDHEESTQFIMSDPNMYSCILRAFICQTPDSSWMQTLLTFVEFVLSLVRLSFPTLIILLQQ